MTHENTGSDSRRFAAANGSPLMTPSEYLTLKRSTQEQIAKLTADLEAAWLESNKTMPPANRRPAKASDIVLGNIIWYDVGPDEYYPTEWAWCEVEKVLCPSSDWKAFETDGTRRGLYGAFVEND